VCPLSLKPVLKKWILRLSSVFLPSSVALVAVLVTLTLLGDIRFPPFLVSVLSLVFSLLLWYTAVLVGNRVRFYFAATFLFQVGILLLLLDLDLVSIPLPRTWPFLMLFVGLSFLFAGLVRYRKPTAIYLVLALTFCGLGGLFLLLSTGFVPGSLKTVLLEWFPLVLIAAGAGLILWLYSSRHTDR